MKGLAAGAADLANWAAHPLLLSALLAAVIGFRRTLDSAWLLAPPLALLAGSAVVLWGTPNELIWQSNSTRERLLVQVLPALLFAYCLLLRQPPPDAAPAAEPSRPRRRK